MSKNYFDIIKQYWDKPHTVDTSNSAQAERERIIKLLEERHRPFQNPCNNARCKIEIHTDCVTCLDEYPCFFVEDIALIKGENK